MRERIFPHPSVGMDGESRKVPIVSVRGDVRPRLPPLAGRAHPSLCSPMMGTARSTQAGRMGFRASAEVAACMSFHTDEELSTGYRCAGDARRG